jgi:hypothetical protein
MLCLLRAIFSFAQPVVKVPPMCEVLVAGIGNGVSTGFGGSVGDGGIVAMPDPFDFKSGEGDFYYESNGTDLIEWNLLGDLSMQTDKDFDDVQQPIGPINPVNIQSFNKNLRFSENPSVTQPLLDNKWARSKGRVTIIYKNKNCNVSIKFDILKRYEYNRDKKYLSLVPPIFGPDCVLPNTVYTYSVDQIASDNPNDEIGFDKYYWSGLPENCLKLYNSTDNSSITFLTGNTVAPFTIQCCYGRANDWDGDSGSPSHTTCITKEIGGQLSQPNFSFSPPTCLPTNQNTFTVVYPNVVSGSYTWTASTIGWILSTSTNTATGYTTLTVDNQGNTSPVNLTLTITGSCNTVVFNYQIDRSISAPFTVVPIGNTTTCLNSTSTNNTYTLSPNIGGNSIEWFTTPAVIPGVTLANTNTAIVTVNTSGVGTGSFTLHARSSIAECNTTNVYTTINIRPAAPVFISTAPTCVPLSSSALSTFAVIPNGASSYTWTLPSGWICANGCTTSNPSLVPPVNNSAVGAAALPSVTLSVVANSATGCSSAATNFTVNYIRITTNTLQSGAGNCDQYSINTNATSCSVTTSSWTVAGVIALSNSSTVNVFGNTLTLCGSTAPAAGSICANVIVNGVLYTTCSSTIATGTHGLKEASPKVVLDGVTIFPNPNDGNFSINIDNFTKSATAKLLDITGKVLGNYTLKKGDNKIENEGLAKGTYIVSLLVDGKTEARKIIIK